MIGNMTGKWELCPKCDVYCETTKDNKCSNCGDPR